MYKKTTNKSIILLSIAILFLITISSVSATNTNNNNITNQQTNNNDLKINENNLKYTNEEKINPNNNDLKERRVVNTTEDIQTEPTKNTIKKDTSNKTSIDTINPLTNENINPEDTNIKMSSNIEQPKLGGIGGVSGRPGDLDHFTSTYINKTYNGPIQGLVNDCVFLNCTFINSSLDMQEYFYHYWLGAPENVASIMESFSCNFTNCKFINSTVEDGSFAYSKRYSLVNFINCTFENITANSIVEQVGGFTLQDAINFYECSFNNVNVKGIIDVPIHTNHFDRYIIEDCTYNGNIATSFDVLTENNRNYINATYRVETILNTDFNEEGNLIISLKDINENGLADEDILLTINDESTPYGLDENGTLSIDLTDFRGELNITVSFEGNYDYKRASKHMSIFLVVKTVTVIVNNTVTEYVNNTVTEYVNKTLESTNIVANDLITTAKVDNSLSIILRDSNGKAIANKVITYSINGVTKTITTDAKGIAKININQQNAGLYYYSLCFLGDNDYKATFKTVKITVNKQTTNAVFKAKTFKAKTKTKKISFTLKDANGKAIRTKKITFKVKGKTYTATTNAKGIATINLKLTKKGKYNINANFAGDNTYKAITKKAKITLK